MVLDSSSANAVNFSSARTTKRFPSRCASAIQIVRPLESIAEKTAPSSNRVLPVFHNARAHRREQSNFTLLFFLFAASHRCFIQVPKSLRQRIKIGHFCPRGTSPYMAVRVQSAIVRLSSGFANSSGNPSNSSERCVGVDVGVARVGQASVAIFELESDLAYLSV